jgi:uncharacterized protein (TIGR03435 family)
MRHAAIALLVFLGQQTAPRPAFEVVSVKANLSRDLNAEIRADPGGRFHALNAQVSVLIAIAYATPQGALRPSQVVGAPNWLGSERYDINARAPDGAALPIDATVADMKPLLQSLLEDRFKLVTHVETRQLPIYALVRARPDGPLGPKLALSSVDCAKEPARCGFKGGPGRVTGSALTSGVLLQLMALATDRVVVDRTGLTGRFDIELEWSPDQMATDKPSIFTAVQEQLGLKLESTRGPVEVLVIDRVERPTED